MLTKTDPLGNLTSYGYDGKHRVVSSSDPEGKARSITYPQTDDAEKTTIFTEKDGGVWSYSYDTQKGYLLAKTDPQGGTTSFGYDSNGNRTSTTNPDGTATSSTYDSAGNITSFTDALGKTTAYSYNKFGQVTASTDPQGGTTAYAYDAMGNMTTLTDPTGATINYEYDARGNVSKTTNLLGQATSLTYDEKGNLATVTDPNGAITGYSYDTAGNLISIADPRGAVTQFEYDRRDRVIKVIAPNGSATFSIYDLNGNKLTNIDANGNATKYEYNSQNQLLKTTDALGYVTRYSYGGTGCSSCGGGGNGKLTSLTDANNNVTAYEYNQLGRLAREIGPHGNTTSYTYDSRGNLTSKTDANGNTISYSYDANGNLLKKNYPDSGEETFTYDAKGNILTAVNKYIGYTFTYDAAGRMLSSTDSNGKAVTYAYDIIGNKIQTTYPEGSVVSYSYDLAGRLAKITNGGGSTYSYTYDILGRRTKLAYPSGANVNYTYDSTGRLTSLNHMTFNGKTIAGFSYGLDKVGNRLSKAEPEVKTSYSYDAIYQLLQAQAFRKHGRDREQVENYTYDPAGNRLSGPRQDTSYTYGPGNQLLARKHAEFSYDKNGNLIAKEYRKYDEGSWCDKSEHHGHGDHDGRKWTYNYDFENRLIKAETKQGHETTAVSFKYDPFGRRIEKKIEQSKHGKTEENTVHRYVYDGQAIILEFEIKQDKEHRKRPVDATTKYVYGPSIDEPLAMVRNNDVYFYHADGLGSIVALTDKKQKVIETYEYDSFGNLKGRDSNLVQSFTYTGREWDKETGIYYYRARYYGPMEGRFISKDPIAILGNIYNNYGKSSLSQYVEVVQNVYIYTGNNPINWTDPSGLFRWHGNWGGPGWTAGQFKPESQLTPSDMKVPAIDDRDACYRGHDICIRNNSCGIKSCDHELASCLRNVSPFNANFWITSQGYPVDAVRESIGFDTFIPSIVHR
jgi:RHS repeat-associated protein